MPNALATLALVLWPAVSVLLFVRLRAGRALIASFLIAYLFLPPPPAGFDFPLLPPLNKNLITSLAALAACIVLYRDKLVLLPSSMAAKALVLVFVFSPLFTVLTNTEPVYFGQFGLPGLQLREAVSMIIQQGLTLAPFLLARALIETEDDLRDVLWALLIGGLVYSIPMLLEVRLSPQLNLWVYGYFQHNFDQMVRFGGFRPIVFLYHGLWVAFFAMTTVIAAFSLAKADRTRRAVALWGAAFYLVVVLFLCKSVASLLYAAALVPVVVFLGQRTQIRVAFVLAILAISYPILKGADLVPEGAMLQQAERIDADRAASLDFRFTNEAILLERAYQKPLFGWGSWGRNQIYDEDGVLQTVTDGHWIIVIGMFGWVGFLAEFGLLAAPIFLIWNKTRGAMPGTLPPCLGAILLILAINMIDLIPNATITPLSWLIAGAILGYAERANVQRSPAPANLRTAL